MNQEEIEGIEAIIYLQSLAGIEEPVERAKAGWRSMTPRQREATLDAYKIIKSLERGKSTDGL